MTTSNQTNEQPAGERAELIAELRGLSTPHLAVRTVLDKAAAMLEADAQRPAMKPLTDEQIRPLCKQSWVFETVKQWARTIEAEFCRINNLEAQPAADDKAHVGESAFEGWYSTYSPAHKSDKQRARDAYAAGMADDKAGGEPVGYVNASDIEQMRKYGGGTLLWSEEHATDDDVVPLYTRPQPQAIPAGYALVPVEPTKEMLDAGQIPTRVVELGNGTTTHGIGLGASPYSIYRAMLAAAPKP